MYRQHIHVFLYRDHPPLTCIVHRLMQQGIQLILYLLPLHPKTDDGITSMKGHTSESRSPTLPPQCALWYYPHDPSSTCPHTRTTRAHGNRSTSFLDRSIISYIDSLHWNRCIVVILSLLYNNID